MPSETVEVCADRLENVLAQSEYVKCQTQLIHGFHVFWNLLSLCYLYILAVSRSMEKMIDVTIEVKKVVGKAVGQGLYWNKDLHKVEPSTVQIW